MAAVWEWLQARVANMLIRAVVASDDDGSKMQLIKILGRTGEVKDGLEHLQPYGLAFRVLPPDADGRGAETVVLALEPDLRMCLPAADRRHRPAGMQSGEVVLYDDQGQTVWIGRDGITITTSRPDGVVVTAPKVVVNSDDVHLGGEGGAQVARIGDLVNVGGGSSAGQWPIVSGSDKVRSN